MPKKKIMRSVTIKELSGVDFPAQTGARALLMKRKGGDPKPVKTMKDLSPEQVAELVKRGAAILTTAENSHSHLVMLEDFDGNKVVSGTTTWQDDHQHPWIMQDDGTVLIGVVDDHSHDPDKESKLAGDTTMTPEEKAKLEKAEKDAKAEKARAARFEAISKFNDATKSYFGTLDEAGQDAFIAKSADDQASDVATFTKAQNDSNPVVYTAEDGTEFRKSDDPRMVKMAKDRDADRKELREQRQINKQADLEKRAGELLPNLPGTIKARAAMLANAEAIEDEELRKQAVDGLVASNKAMAPAFKSLGAGNQPTQPAGESASDQLDDLAAKRAEKDGISQEEAYDKVLKTPEGEALFNKHRQEQIGRAAH